MNDLQTILVAKELNSVLKLTPQIDVESWSLLNIKSSIIECSSLIKEEDEFSISTWEYLFLFGALKGSLKEKALTKIRIKRKENFSNIKEEVPLQKIDLKIKRRNKAPQNILIEELISKGEFTKEEILLKVQEKFPEIKKQNIVTVLCHCRNEKYSHFGKVAYEDKNKILKWK